MKVAVIGSRCLTITDLGNYLPYNCTEIVSGGANGIDTCAENYADEHQLRLTVFTPYYQHYKRGAPSIRNRQIVDYADMVIAFWDGKSRGTKSVIEYCKQTETPCRIIEMKQDPK